MYYNTKSTTIQKIDKETFLPTFSENFDRLACFLESYCL